MTGVKPPPNEPCSLRTVIDQHAAIDIASAYLEVVAAEFGAHFRTTAWVSGGSVWLWFPTKADRDQFVNRITVRRYSDLLAAVLAY